MNYSNLDVNSFLILLLKKIFLIFLFICYCNLGFITEISAQTITVFTHPYLPPYFFLVDKQKQNLYVAKFKNNFIEFLTKEPCSTGSNRGDKSVIGDERTPEGIYFLTKKITIPLNYELYGNLAYATNYPNPIDRLFKKNGGGIWLHGRGKKLIPFDTRGCIALKTSALKKLKPYIKQDLTPILIGSKIEIKHNTKSLLKEINTIKQLTNKWITAWRNKDKSFFNFYDPIAFSKANNISFKQFKKNKLYYFSKYKWIDIFILKPYILTGPYYIISYFYEFFRSPQFYTTGIKRLYWMRGNYGYKIVASEWIPKKLNLEKDYITYHKKRILDFINEWKKSWEAKDIEKYASFYDKNALQNKIKGLHSIISFKKALWENTNNISINISNINLRLINDGFEIIFLQKYNSTNHKDVGKKKLVIYPYKNSYKILNEFWSPL